MSLVIVLSVVMGMHGEWQLGRSGSCEGIKGLISACDSGKCYQYSDQWYQLQSAFSVRRRSAELSMWADTLLILFISVCTALLGEGELHFITLCYRLLDIVFPIGFRF